MNVKATTFKCWGWMFESWMEVSIGVLGQDSLVAISKSFCDKGSIPLRENGLRCFSWTFFTSMHYWLRWLHFSRKLTWKLELVMNKLVLECKLGIMDSWEKNQTSYANDIGNLMLCKHLDTQVDIFRCWHKISYLKLEWTIVPYWFCL